MIKSFRDNKTEKIWQGGSIKQIPQHIQKQALERIRQLNVAKDVKDLANPSSNRLKKLKGNRNGQYSIRVNEKWRICFIWNQAEANVYNVELVDYH